MKYVKIILIILILFVFLNFIGEVKNGNITSKSIFDIRAVQSVGTSVSVVIDNGPPTIFLDSPLNKTYNYNATINLNFTVFDASDVSLIWYNLNNTNNITITENITFAASEGTNTLYFFANDSFGFLNDSKSVTFNINSSKGYNITYTEFTLTGAEITQFNSLTKGLQTNIQDVILHVPGYGKIKFNEDISITSDTNLDNYIEIGSNLITLNSDGLPDFNKAATLELYSLTFTNPKIKMDGSDCSSTICKINSYSNGTLSFNVTHFTTYSAAETTVSSGAPSGSNTGGGGSGGGSTSEIDEINIDKDSIKVKMKLDETKNDYLIIENKENKKIKLTLTINPEIGFVFIESGLNKYSFDIDALESRNIEIKIRANSEDKVKEGVYVSKLIIEGDNFKKVLPVVIEVESKGPTLFDVEVTIPSEYSVVEPGNRIVANLLLFNLGVTGVIDAKIDYEIIDLDGNIILSESEIQGVETQFQKVKELIIPRDAEPGKYVLSVKVTYYEGEKERIATATYFFEIGEEKIQFPLNVKLNYYLIIIIILSVSLIMFAAYHFGILRALNHHIHKKKSIKRKK